MSTEAKIVVTWWYKGWTTNGKGHTGTFGVLDIFILMQMAVTQVKKDVR